MEISLNFFSDALHKTVGVIFLLKSPGDAAIFAGSLHVQMPFALRQLHLWMIHLTNRPVFKCICSEEAVVFQTATLWASDIFAASESRQCKNRCLMFFEPPSWGRCKQRTGDILKPMFHTDPFFIGKSNNCTLLNHRSSGVQFVVSCLWFKVNRGVWQHCSVCFHPWPPVCAFEYWVH